MWIDLLKQIQRTVILCSKILKSIFFSFQIAQKFAAHITDHTKVYLDRVVENTNTSIGRCGPLSRIFNATLTATCDKVLLPWVSR